MNTLLAGIGWMFGFVGLGLMMCMSEVIDACRDIFGKRRE